MTDIYELKCNPEDFPEHNVTSQKFEMGVDLNCSMQMYYELKDVSKPDPIVIPLFDGDNN